MTTAREGWCNDAGPWGSICTNYPAHDYSHYDSGADRSWQDDWREETPVSGGGTYIDPIETALSFIDQTIYGVEDVPTTPWRSDEVVTMLRELRVLVEAI